MTYQLGNADSLGRREIRVVPNRNATMSDKARRYGIALLTSVTTLGVVALLARILPFEPFLLFVVPVVLTSRYAGRGPTALAVVLCALGIEATLIVSSGRFRFSIAELWIHAALFAIVAFAIDSSSEALRKAGRDAKRSAERLEDVNVELEQQMDQIQVLSEDLHRTNESLAAARDKAEDASRAREEVLAIVAHDLRNPLNLLMMTTQLFAETQPSAEKRDQLLGVIRRTAQRMNRLIEDLLEVVRQESGHMKLEVEAVPVASLVAQTAEMFQTSAVEKGVSLRVEECPGDLTVRCDAERIMQVLSNLVGNALKFVPRGGSVLLKCDRRATEALFSVADSGPGIAREDLDRLFEKFWQRRHTDKRGVGLGLAIARGIVEAHGGRIWAESRVGVGSTFYFTLPAVSVHSSEQPIATLVNADGLVGATRPELLSHSAPM
jgi:signal transduction histidine kinase